MCVCVCVFYVPVVQSAKNKKNFTTSIKNWEAVFLSCADVFPFETGSLGGYNHHDSFFIFNDLKLLPDYSLSHTTWKQDAHH